VTDEGAAGQLAPAIEGYRKAASVRLGWRNTARLLSLLVAARLRQADKCIACHEPTDRAHDPGQSDRVRRKRLGSWKQRTR